VAGYLVKATCKPGEDYELLRNMYEQVINQRNRELGHVANLVGGMVKKNLRFGDADRVFHPVNRARQKEAVEFLNQHAFRTPKELLDPDILWRLEPNGAADRVLSGQRRLLRSLVNERRVKRMAEHAAMAGDEAYPAHEMLADVHKAIWAECDQTPIKIDLYRRNLQRAHVEVLTGEIDKTDASSDLPALTRGELERIAATLEQAREKASADEMTSRHLKDLSKRVKDALEGKDKKKEAANDL
jgi:K+/H+ antiporter YhaU regulatory subunit KhtT